MTTALSRRSKRITIRTMPMVCYVLPPCISRYLLDRPRVHVPTSRTRHRKMLRPHLLRSPQPHPGRSVARRNHPRHRRLDRALYVAPFAQVASGRHRPGHHSAPQLAHCQPDQAQGAIPVHADLREQGRCDGLLEPAPARPSLDHQLVAGRTRDGTGAVAEIPARARR